MKYENINVIERDIPCSKVVDFIDFVVNNSYGKDGRYHAYLRDYSEAVAIITMYTDCDISEHSFDDIMELIASKKWNDIINALCEKYFRFDRYVNAEIEYRNTPMRYADDFVKSGIEVFNNINSVIKAVDIDALKQFDFSKITDALEEVNDFEENKSKTKNTKTTRKTKSNPNIQVVK